MNEAAISSLMTNWINLVANFRKTRKALEDVGADFDGKSIQQIGFQDFPEAIRKLPVANEQFISRLYTQIGGVGGLDISNVEIIGDGAFAYSPELLVAYIPEGVQSIGSYAFSSCHKLRTVTMPDSVEVLDLGVFSGSFSLYSIKFSNNENFKSIPEICFQGCDGLRSIIIPDQITTISRSAFAFCDNLEKIVFGKKINTIRQLAFNKCINCSLFDFSTAELVPTLENANAFDYVAQNVDTGFKIKVPPSLYSAWRSETNWDQLPSSSFTVE